MKKHVVTALKWALSKFDDKPALAEAWPFPVVLGTPPACEKAEVKKPKVAKATTRAKKPAVVAKTTRTKKAK
jgi:hypothetical protein